jgi:ribosomal protein S27AE
MSTSFFTERVGVIATMHQKQKVIAPLLEQKLNIKTIVPDNFNTDSFGTFTREIKRQGTQVEAARLKAESALLITNETLAFASEGTFGPHPALSYLPCNREIVLLLDKTNNLEVIGQALSTETNYNHQIVKNLEAAFNFASKVGFPEHGLIVRIDHTEIIKGITTEKELIEAVESTLKQSPSGIQIETDMRAMYNPTRMKNIERATRDLIKKLQQVCPNCSYPGFDVAEYKKGLPCAICHLPTSLTLAEIYQCKHCNFRQEVLFPNSVKNADTAQCMYCNP